MNQLGDILLLDIIILFFALFFGVTGFLKVLAIEIIYTLLWIGGHA